MSQFGGVNVFKYAKEIRRTGEVWQEAVKRAAVELRSQAEASGTYKPRKKLPSKPTRRAPRPPVKSKSSECAGLTESDCKDECYWVKTARPYNSRKGKVVTRKAHCAVKPFRFPTEMPQ